MPDPNKAATITLRVSEEQKAKLYAHTNSLRVAISDWLREKVLAALEVETMATGGSGVAQIGNKDMRELVREYVEACGAHVEVGGTGHYKVCFPGVQRPVVVTGTSSGRRVIPNTRADLERAKREWEALQPKAAPPAPSTDGLEQGDSVVVGYWRDLPLITPPRWHGNEITPTVRMRWVAHCGASDFSDFSSHCAGGGCVEGTEGTARLPPPTATGRHPTVL